MMLNFLIYLGKTSVAMGVFYLTFLVLFQQQKQFRFNRAYLLMALVVSFVIPLITIPVIHYIDVAISGSTASTLVYLSDITHEGSVSRVEFSLFHYLFGLYVLGQMGFLLHLVISHLRAIRIIRRSKVQMCCNLQVRITSEDVHPFSFFNTIVISERTLSSPNIEMIVHHEKIHVQEKHSIDIFLAELVFLFQWFNPFAWLLKNAVRNNLEYKTDHEITKTYHPQEYQLAMVALADKKEVSPFLTALNGSQLKNRIIMMKMKTQTKFRVVKQLIVVPLLIVLIVGLSKKEVISKPVHGNTTVAADSNSSNLVGNVSANDNNWSITGGLKGELNTTNSDGMKLSVVPDDDMVLRFSKESNGAYPPIFVDGVRHTTNSNDFNFGNATIEDFAKEINVKPEDIESIEVLKGEATRILLGDDSDAESVLLIKTNDETINTSLKLRKAIANRIKFPYIAASMKGGLALSLYATVSESGKITAIEEQVAENKQFITLDEVVITAYRNSDEPQKSEADYKVVLSKEAKRVLEDIHQFNIPELNGKVVKFQFKFQTQ